MTSRRHPLDNAPDGDAADERDLRSAAVPQGRYVPERRSWFARHKFLSLLLALAVIAGIATAAGGGKKDGSSSDEGRAGGGAKAATLNTPVRDGKFEFTVLKVDKGKATVGDPVLNQRAQGQYVLVTVRVKNIGDQQQALSDTDQKLLDGTNRQFTADSAAGLSIKNNQVLFQQINPGNQVQGVMVFDMPKGTKPAKLELHDSPFSDGVSVTIP